MNGQPRQWDKERKKSDHALTFFSYRGDQAGSERRAEERREVNRHKGRDEGGKA
jgi:hypothetical protein